MLLFLAFFIGLPCFYSVINSFFFFFAESHPRRVGDVLFFLMPSVVPLRWYRSILKGFWRDFCSV